MAGKGDVVGESRLLGEQGVRSVCQDGDARFHLVAACDDAAYPPVAHDEVLHGDAVDEVGSRLLGPLGQPLVEGSAQHRVGVLARLAQLVGREVHGEQGIGGGHRYLLVRDAPLQGSASLEVGEHAGERMRVDAPAGHVLGAGVVAAFHYENGTARGGQPVGCDRAGAPGADDDRVELIIGHGISLSVGRVA